MQIGAIFLPNLKLDKDRLAALNATCLQNFLRGTSRYENITFEMSKEMKPKRI